MDFHFGEDADMVRQTAHEFVRRDLLPQEPKLLNAKSEDERKELVKTAADALKEMGLYSAGVPEEFGGGGLGPIETCLIAEELSQTIIPVEWGELTPVLYECGEALKEDFLAPVVDGSKRYALGFREPESFASPAGMNANAAHRDGNWVLNGTKILSRGEADFYLVFAKTAEGPTCFVVENGAPGAETRPAKSELPETELALKDCAVAAERVIGQPGKAIGLGRRWFPLTRIIRAAAVLGACDRLLAVSAQYAHDWSTMGRPIHERKAVQQMLADTAAAIDGLRWMVYHAAWLAAEGKKVEYDSMLVKVHAQKVLTDTVNDSVRTHGGTMPPICAWLARNAAGEEVSDMLRLAVAEQTIARLLP